MNDNVFLKELSKLDIQYNDDMLEKLDVYYEELKKYNSHTNLTSIIEKDSVYLKHFYDSLTITKAYDFKNGINLLDIGTGAGFPGLVIKIFFPQIKLVLLDSNKKKTDFLEMICKKLGLNDTKVVNKRAEDYIKEFREKFDVVTSRAVAKTRILCELSLPFLKNNGVLILMKANDEITKLEIDESTTTISILNSKLEKIISFNLPIENSQRNLLVIKKVGSISDLYPRSYDKILKKPLK